MNYEDVIEKTAESGNLLDVLKALQKEEGYLTEDAIRAAAKAFHTTPNVVYETASFYTMLRLKKGAAHRVQVCLSTCCSVQKGNDLFSELKKMGLADTEITRCECLGRCDTAPNALVDGKLVTNADTDRIRRMIEEGASEEWRKN